jgi:hypothetical protein
MNGIVKYDLVGGISTIKELREVLVYGRRSHYELGLVPCPGFYQLTSNYRLKLNRGMGQGGICR